MDKSNIIGVQEKRELARIISQDFDRIISNLQQEIKFTEGEILEEAHKKFGIKAINLQIEQLQKQVNLLEKRKEELGFDRYDKFSTTWDRNSQVIDLNTKAGRYYYMKVARHMDIQALETEKAKRLKQLWLTDIRKDVALLANQDIKVKLIERKSK